MKNDLLEHIEDVHRELADAKADADRLAEALAALMVSWETMRYEIPTVDDTPLESARAALDAHHNAR